MSADGPFRARELRTLTRALSQNQAVSVLHEFRLRSSGCSEIHLGASPARRVIISSTDPLSLESDWRLLSELVARISELVVPRASEPAQRFTREADEFTRPLALLDSPVLARLPGGSVCLVDDAARLLSSLDRTFLRFASDEGARPIVCPPIWHEDQLDGFGYQRDSANLLRVQRPGGAELYWQLAACNTVWLHLSGATLTRPAVFSVQGTCCRGEGGHYFLLERMRSFTMREITFAGSAAEVGRFRQRALEFLAATTRSLGLGGALTVANDPFFLLERADDAPSVEASKMELRLDLYDNKSIACASVNVHGDFFSNRLGIHAEGGETPVWTACVAFGLERWGWAVLTQFGPDRARWPEALRRSLGDAQ